jgi:dolichol-phosphate mannosyltransferase
MDSSLPQTILVMPAYNEAASIDELLRRAATALSAEGLPWAIVVVDDGSRDETAEIVRLAAEGNNSILLVQHPRNLGLGPAIVTGLARALEVSSDPKTLVVCMDADLTHPPEIIPQMRKAAEEGADIVIASRFQPGSRQVGLSPFRRLLSWGARRVFRLALNIPGVRDYTCGFRAFRAPVLARGFERFGRDGLIRRRGFACTDELLIKLALLNPAIRPVIREVPFILRYDLKRGKSKIRIGVTIAETIRLIFWARRELRRDSR